MKAHDAPFAAGPVSIGGGGWIGVCAEECVAKAIHGRSARSAASIHSAVRRDTKLVRYSRCGAAGRVTPAGVAIVRFHA